MMFPHVITIYRHSIGGNNDVYTRQVVTGVYWNESNGISKDGKGVANSRKVVVTTSKALCDTLGVEWTIQDNDRIIKGEGSNITKLADLTNSYTVTGITVNQCGSKVDNVVIEAV